MSSFEWLSRAGHADLWYKFEAEDIMLVREAALLRIDNVCDQGVSLHVCGREIKWENGCSIGLSWLGVLRNVCLVYVV